MRCSRCVLYKYYLLSYLDPPVPIRILIIFFLFLSILGTDKLLASMLANATPQEQKQILGERLYPVIERMHPNMAGKITGMLLEIENSELLHMIEVPDALKAKVEEAVAVLQVHNVRGEAVPTN